MKRHLLFKLSLSFSLLFFSFSVIPNLSFGQDCSGTIDISNNSGLGDPDILDPDGDGDIIGDNTQTLFTSGTSEFDEFEQLTGSVICANCEIPWTRMPSLVSEDNNDIVTGGNCGNTDIISDSDGGEDYAYFTVFENNGLNPESTNCSFSDIWIAFRVRIADASSGNFAFSILMSNDGAMWGEQVLDQNGNLVLDLNGNPVVESFQCCGSGKAMNVGFEKEILLQAGGSAAQKGVYIYNVDDRIGGGSGASYEKFLNQSVSANVAAACGQDVDCTNTPVFYTFAMPLSDLGFTDCSIFKNQFAAAAVSGSSGNSILHECNSTSDIGGVRDNDENACTTLPCEFGPSAPCPTNCNVKAGQNLLCAANVDLGLPVELIYFNAVLKDKAINLNWSTASEQNNLGFDIQRSNDGRSWETLDFVPGRGTTSETIHYSFEDAQPLRGYNYYRLKQMDFDGQFEYSEVVTVLFDGGKDELMKVFPNPSSGLFKVGLSNPHGEKAFIKLFDSTGGLIWTKQFNNAEAELYWEKEFDLPQREVYLLVTQVGTHTETQKVVIIDEK